MIYTILHPTPEQTHLRFAILFLSLYIYFLSTILHPTHYWQLTSLCYLHSSHFSPLHVDTHAYIHIQCIYRFIFFKKSWNKQTMVEKSNLVVACALLLLISGINGEDPYRFFTWKVTYGDIYPMGVKQQVYFLFLISRLFIMLVS